MKSIIFLACLVAFVAAQDNYIEGLKNRLKEIQTQCVQEVSATDDDLKDVMECKVPSTRTGLCLVNCIHQKFGIADGQGKFVRAGMMKLIEPMKAAMPEKYNALMKLADKCEPEVKMGTDACENAKSIMECVHKYKEEVGLD